MIIKFKDETTCEIMKIVNSVIPEGDGTHYENMEIFFKLDDERSLTELFELFNGKDLSSFTAESTDGVTKVYDGYTSIETVADTFDDVFKTKILRIVK